jgi:hypothetical protein
MGRWQRAWDGLRDPPPQDERAEIYRRVRERQLRRLRRERVWRRWGRRGRWLDPAKPPLTVLRWLGVLGIALAWWATGAATSPPHKWLPYAVIVGALILPDVAGFAVGGFKLDLKEAQDEIATLRQEVNAQARATSMSIVALGDEAFRAAQGLTSVAIQAVRSEETGPAVPWPPPGSGIQPPRSTANPDTT